MLSASVSCAGILNSRLDFCLHRPSVFTLYSASFPVLTPAVLCLLFSLEPQTSLLYVAVEIPWIFPCEVSCAISVGCGCSSPSNHFFFSWSCASPGHSERRESCVFCYWALVALRWPDHSRKAFPHVWACSTSQQLQEAEVTTHASTQLVSITLHFAFQNVVLSQ